MVQISTWWNIFWQKWLLRNLSQAVQVVSWQSIPANQTLTSFILQMYFEMEKFDTKQIKTESKNW